MWPKSKLLKQWFGLSVSIATIIDLFFLILSINLRLIAVGFYKSQTRLFEEKGNMRGFSLVYVCSVNGTSCKVIRSCLFFSFVKTNNSLAQKKEKQTNILINFPCKSFSHSNDFLHVFHVRQPSARCLPSQSGLFLYPVYIRFLDLEWHA